MGKIKNQLGAIETPSPNPAIDVIKAIRSSHPSDWFWQITKKYDDFICKTPYQKVTRKTVVPDVNQLAILSDEDIFKLRPTKVHYDKGLVVFGMSMSDG